MGRGPEPGRPPLKLSPPTPGGAPVCSPQQYKDCADPALGKGQASPHTIPSLPASACYPHPAAGSPDPGNCGPQMPCCGRTRAPAPTRAPPRATPRSSPWCGCRAALPPATWPGNTTAARPTSRELGQSGEGWTPFPRPRLPSHTWVGHQSSPGPRTLDRLPNLSAAVSSAKRGGDAPPGALERSQSLKNDHVFAASSWHRGLSSEHPACFPPGTTCWY